MATGTSNGRTVADSVGCGIRISEAEKENSIGEMEEYSEACTLIM
jgi:hypothetical protein